MLTVPTDPASRSPPISQRQSRASRSASFWRCWAGSSSYSVCARH